MISVFIRQLPGGGKIVPCPITFWQYDSVSIRQLPGGGKIVPCHISFWQYNKCINTPAPGDKKIVRCPKPSHLDYSFNKCVSLHQLPGRRSSPLSSGPVTPWLLIHAIVCCHTMCSHLTVTLKQTPCAEMLRLLLLQPNVHCSIIYTSHVVLKSLHVFPIIAHLHLLAQYQKHRIQKAKYNNLGEKPNVQSMAPVGGKYLLTIRKGIFPCFNFPYKVRCFKFVLTYAYWKGPL